MRIIFFLLIFITVSNCNKQKTVLICGDHVCINKSEAEQFFKDNLFLEVKIIDRENSKDIDLVELNLKSNKSEKKEISITQKTSTEKKLKVLSKEEIQKKKDELRIRKKKKIDKKTKENKLVKKVEKEKKVSKAKKVVNNQIFEITDVCTIIEKCSIDEISKYLVKQGKEKKFPDITIRENK
tara:strand:- start:2297 stop:2842 length:546 start_codon:yes stop_codon:yes gene_type:complete